MNAPAGAGPLRRLVVLRHAKSAWPEGVEDHRRPLAPRGL
ncbi:histidine phosphatase family protein, partial [Streptomyces sp. NPDC004658]